MSLLLLALAVPVVFFAAARALEYFIGGERRFGAVQVRLHGPEISFDLSMRADSAIVLAPGFRLDLFKPSLRLVDGFSLDPSGATLLARADSAFLRLRPSGDTAARPLVFPPAFRFPLSTRAEWRALTVRARDGFDLEAGRGKLRSRGAYGAEGSFTLRAPGGDRSAPEARVTFGARWTGERVRYSAVARRAPRDSLRIAGNREKRDLRFGVDTVRLASDRPADWLPPALASRFPDVSRLRASGSADWRARNLKVTGAASTGAWRFLRPCDWTFDARLEAEGGRLALSGEGGGQTFRATGSWSHPEAWLKAPEWKQCEAEVSAETRGVEWKIGRFVLPIEFTVPSATLRSGLDAKARVVTGDGSELDLVWDGRRPGRLEFSGPVSPTEAWAVAWTDSQLFYREAFARGSWENGRVRVRGDFRDVLAYGAEADSVRTENEVSSRQYTLRSATIFKDGEAFTGSGWVRWRDDANRRAVSLRFEAAHPEYGSGVFAMPRLGRLEARAVNLRAARFPYRPLARFAALDPWIEGAFDWDLRSGDGLADLNTALSGGHNVLRGRLLADWTRDSLRVSEGDLASGAARVSARGVLPLRGKSLRGLSGLRTLAGGTWRLGVDSLRAGDVFTLFGKAARPVEGDLNGALEYSPALGLRGAMRLDSIRVPALRDDAEIGGVSLLGLGDSVSVILAVGSKRFPGLVDTVHAMFSGFDSAGPRFWARTRSATGLRVNIMGEAPRWTVVTGTLNVAGSLPLGARAGLIDSIRLDGGFSTTLGRNVFRDLAFNGEGLHARYTVAGESQSLSGTPSYAAGQLRVSDLRIRNVEGGYARGAAEVDFFPLAARADLEGDRFTVVLPAGQRFEARDFSAKARWRSGDDLSAELEARSGSFFFPPAPYRVEGRYDNLRLKALLPTSPTAPASLAVRGRIHDFLFERKLADRKIERDLGALFNFARSGAPRPSAGPRRTRPWDLDIDVEAVGSRNRVETDVLRMNFIGDMRVKGVAPYLLVTGRVSGLQGEIGQARQAYTLRDFEVKWANAALEEGRVSVEGEKRVRVDCRAETKQTCPFYIRVEGRLRDADFTYDTDCGQSSGEQVAPTVLITSMSRGCYAGDASGDGAYGSAALASLEPLISGQLSRGFARGSGGFIKSTQVSGLGAIMGGDSSGLEAVSLEVESRELYRVGLKGKAGYHPETKQASPMEYRMAAEYRPPLERWAAEGSWRRRWKDRFTVEAAVETRPETRDIEEDRRVQQRVGLRYRYRFWDLW